jgi:hypothetical protein
MNSISSFLQSLLSWLSGLLGGPKPAPAQPSTPATPPNYSIGTPGDGSTPTSGSAAGTPPNYSIGTPPGWPPATSGSVAAPAAPTGPTLLPDSQTEPTQVLSLRALVVVFNPILNASTGLRLLQTPEAARWSNVDTLLAGYIADVDACSGGLVKYQVVDRVTRDYFPVKQDQFTYDAASYLQAVHTGQYHNPDLANYDPLLADLQLLQRAAQGDFDEVWFFGGPGFGFYESRMAGPGAFWCNSPQIDNTAASGRRFVIMGFSYERGVGEMLEDLGHRAESVLDYRWRSVPDAQNLWKKYARYDLTAPGQAEVGVLHFAPNSTHAYDWGNPTPVLTRADTWLSFPDLGGPAKTQNCAAWGNGDIRAHHQWWLKRLPKAPGRLSSVANNWWRYVANVADSELDW